MLNRKLIIAGVICVTILSLTACGKKKDNSVDNVKLDNNTEEITEETREETDDEFEYLYHDALKGEVLNKDEKESVQKEYKVVKGEFSSGIAEIGELVYENLMYERVEANEVANLVFLVGEGDKVSKGDVVATYDIVKNDVDIAEEKRNVERMEKEYSAQYNSKKAEINMAEYELEKLTDKKDIEIKKLQIQKLKNILNKYKETGKTIEDARDRLNDTIRRNDIVSVVAKNDGYVVEVHEDDEGHYYKGDVVLTLSDKKQYHIEVQPHEGVSGLKYGSDVTIVVEKGKNGKDVSFKGKVVAAPNVLSASYYNSVTEIMIIDEPEGVDWNKPVKVRYEGVHIDDALLVPTDAVMTEKTGGGAFVEDAEYVYISEGDVIYKSYLNIIDKNNDYYRVCDGVSEGDTLVCYK